MDRFPADIIRELVKFIPEMTFPLKRTCKRFDSLLTLEKSNYYRDIDALCHHASIDMLEWLFKHCRGFAKYFSSMDWALPTMHDESDDIVIAKLNWFAVNGLIFAATRKGCQAWFADRPSVLLWLTELKV